MGMFKISKFGDWGDVTDLLKRKLNKAYSQASEETLKRVTLKGERIVVLHLRNNDLPWQPLRQATLANKARKGQSNKTLIATTDYLNSISSFTKRNVGFVGVRKKVVNAQGQALVDIAKVHEYGSISRSIPARPLWQPSFKELEAWIKQKKISQIEMIKAFK